MYKKSGPRLIRMLKKRRDDLDKISDRYYLMISKYLSIWTSNKPELAEINRLDDNLVEIAIYKKNDPMESPFFYRVFDKQQTKDIRLYLQGGDDEAIVRGIVNSSITVRIIGGPGADKLVDSSIVKGYLLYLLPIADPETKTEFYDSDKNTEFLSLITIFQLS